MASVAANQLSQQEISELACTYASLILYDDGQDITAEKLSSLISASDVKVESYWPKLFAKAIAGQNISDFFNFGGAASSGSAPAASQPVAESKPADNKKQDKKKKEEPKVE